MEGEGLKGKIGWMEEWMDGRVEEKSRMGGGMEEVNRWRWKDGG